jgi:hypothetical protein
VKKIKEFFGLAEGTKMKPAAKAIIAVWLLMMVAAGILLFATGTYKALLGTMLRSIPSRILMIILGFFLLPLILVLLIVIGIAKYIA